MGGKASAPAPPDYRPIANADAAAAAAQTQLGQEQLDWAKGQFNTVWPYAQQYLQSQMGATNQEQQFAQQQESTYNSTYLPIEKSFANTALNYDNPANANQQAGAAEAQVATSLDASRASATSQLESFGIDPSQTRYQALDLGTRVAQGASTAAAGTQSYLNTQNTALQLQGAAINTGRGYPAAISGANNTGTSAGAAGLSGANSTTATGANTMGTPAQYMGLATASLGGAANALNFGFNNALGSANLNYNIQANQAQGIGSAFGGALGLAASFL
jgi:hypothetical protein